MTIENNTINLTPEQAKARLRQSEKTIKAALEGVVPPFALGIGKAVKQAHPEIPAKHLSTVLGWITHSPEYLKATIKADHRTALDGSTSELLEEHKTYALKQLEKPKAKKKAKPVVQQTPKVVKQEVRKPVAPVITIRRRKVLSLPKRENAV